MSKLTKLKKTAIAFVMAGALGVVASPAMAVDHGKVLVILSGAKTLDLKDGKKYPTGFYLDELAVPLQKIIDAGYTPVFASPNGDTATFDPASNINLFFNNDDAARLRAIKLVEGEQGPRHPKKFSTVISEGTKEYVGVFVPGGHAPMQDLIQNKELGQILRTFHANQRPTAVICHGPAALLSTLDDPVAFRQAMIKGDLETAGKLAKDWPYAGYRVTVFAAAEEHLLEGAGNQLGGNMLFQAADALAEAGAHVDRVAIFHPNVVEDREVVSGQQPLSSDALGTAFVAKLKAAKPH